MSDFNVVLPQTTEEWQRDMNIVYNQALEDLREKLLDTIAHKYNYPYFDDAIYGLVNDALVDSVNELNR